MEKISGILPSNSRLTSVDMKDSAAVRPGIPSFGRNIGESNLATRINRSSLMPSISSDLNSLIRSPKDIENEELISNLSDEFFMHKNISSKTDAVEPESFENFNEEGIPDYIRPGRYIDVEV